MIIGVLAVSLDGAIGVGPDLPWGRKMPGDLRRFRALTMGGVVLVGRKTWETMPPLDGRYTVVLTRSIDYPQRADNAMCGDPKGVLLLASDIANDRDNPHIYVCGGRSLYEQFIPHCDRLVVTRVHCEVPGDAVRVTGLLPTPSDSLGFSLDHAVHHPAHTNAPDEYSCTVGTYNRKR